MTEEKQWQGENRRTTPRSGDKFYLLINILNLVAWGVFIAALIVFHYARPELIFGVQEFWGVEGRQDWSGTLSFYLIVLLTICTGLGLTTAIMKRQRSRRKNDFFGINLLILLVIAVSSLVWIFSEMH